MINIVMFIQAGFLASFSPLISPGTVREGERLSDDSLKEPEIELKIVREADVIVCGGWPAGIAAANVLRTGRTLNCYQEFFWS